MKKILMIGAVASFAVGDVSAMFGAKERMDAFYEAGRQQGRSEAYAEFKKDKEKERAEAAKRSPIRRRLQRVSDVCSGVWHLVSGVGSLGYSTAISSLYSVSLLPVTWSIGNRAFWSFLGHNPRVSFLMAGGLVSAVNLVNHGYADVVNGMGSLREKVVRLFDSGKSRFDDAVQDFNEFVESCEKRLFDLSGETKSGGKGRSWASSDDTKSIIGLDRDIQLGYKVREELKEEAFRLIDISTQCGSNSLSQSSLAKWKELRSKYLGSAADPSSDGVVAKELSAVIGYVNDLIKSNSADLRRKRSQLRNLKFKRMMSPVLKLQFMIKGMFEEGVRLTSFTWNFGVGASLWGASILTAGVGFPMLMASSAPGIVGLLLYDGLRNLGFWRLSSWGITEGVVFISSLLTNGLGKWGQLGGYVSEGFTRSFESIDTGVSLLFPTHDEE